MTPVCYDTEFIEDGRTIDLISIGMVAEDGREYYAVASDAPWDQIRKHDWLLRNRDPEQIAPWLSERGITCRTDDAFDEREFWNVLGTVLISRRKYPAVAYIDDRGIRFQSWTQALADLAALTGAANSDAAAADAG